MTQPVGALIATHDRVWDARCCMEIIRSVWQPVLGAVRIVHAFNGDPAWYPAPYLEDTLVRVPPEPTHFRGAASLIDAGLAAFADTHPDCRYVVVLAADVWALDPVWLRAVVTDLERDGQRLASAEWRISPTAHGIGRVQDPALLPANGLATDFFVVDLPWALRWGMIPLRYGEFLDRNADLLNYLQELPFLERHVAGRFLAAVRSELAASGPGKDPWGSAGPRTANALLRLMRERAIDPDGRTAPSHKGHWPAIGLVTSEDAGVKQALLADVPAATGSTLDRLRADPDTTWFVRRRPDKAGP